jgi:hypothetical protein
MEMELPLYKGANMQQIITETTMNVHEHISDIQIHVLAIFIVSAIVGMIFSYYKAWSWGDTDIKFRSYLLGDSRAVGRALTTFALMCAAAISLDYLTALNDLQIAVAGAGLGYMVPDNVAAKQAQEQSIQAEELVERIKKASVKQDVTEDLKNDDK